MNNNYGKLSSTEFNQWLDKVSDYEDENCVESISESSDEIPSNCFIKEEYTPECSVQPVKMLNPHLTSCHNENYIPNPVSSTESNKHIYVKSSTHVIERPSCLKTYAVPLDSEYFDAIIPPIALLYKDKNKVQMIQNKNISSIQSVNIKRMRNRRRKR